MSTAIAIGASTLQLPDPGENYSLALVNQNNTNIATEVNKTTKQALGLIQKKRVTGSTAAPSTTLAVIDNFGSVSLKAGRHYRIAWHINNYTGSAANTYINCFISQAPVADAANLTTNLTNVETVPIAATVANTGQSASIFGYIDPVADTITQIKFLTQVVTGTSGVVSAYVCIVEDMGLQF